MATITRRAAALAALMVTLAGCDSVFLGGGPERELELNRARWEARSLSSYEYTLRRGCFCPPAYIGPVRIRVEGGVVTERTYVDSGDPVVSGLEDAFPAVDGLFDVLADAYEQDAHSVEVTYEPETGVPLDIYIDYIENAVDEELGLTVTSVPSSIP